MTIKDGAETDVVTRTINPMVKVHFFVSKKPDLNQIHGLNCKSVSIPHHMSCPLPVRTLMDLFIIKAR